MATTRFRFGNHARHAFPLRVNAVTEFVQITKALAMKFTLSWLKDHLETAAPLQDILYALTDLGLEVEGVENPAQKLGAFRICKVIEAAPHPNADRLRLCRVATWPDGPDGPQIEVQVVCGAPTHARV